MTLPAIACQAQEIQNVNSRYTVESVEIVPRSENRISSTLRRDIQKIIGDKLDPSVLQNLARRIQREAHARTVMHRITRGAQPEHVKVVFEVVRRKQFEANATRLAYHSGQGLSGGLEGTVRVGRNAFTAGVVSDNDELLERFAGVQVRYEREELLGPKTSFRMEVDSYHQQWNQATASNSQTIPAGTGDTSGLYRTRFNLQPTISVRLTRDLSLSTGFSFQRLRNELPAARTEASNSVVNTLRYRRSWEGSDASQTLDAAYTLRAATRTLASDYVYARHLVSGRYEWQHGHSAVRLLAMMGTITGRAPLYERFVLGNSSTLRGWSKYDVQPLGGARLGYASAEYRYRMLHAFYDTGAVWNRNEKADVKHAVGAGLHAGNLYFSLGLPVREGRMTPIFIVAMNF